MNQAKKAIYPGTFDPITFGHIDVIKRALQIFDEIVVAVADNPHKKPFFSLAERKELAEKSLKGVKNVQVKTFSSLLVDFARKEKASIAIRGLREMSDFPSEFQQAVVNRKLSSSMETVFVMTNPDFFYFSSSVVKELALHGAPVSRFVPKVVEKKLREKLENAKYFKLKKTYSEKLYLKS